MQPQGWVFKSGVWLWLHICPSVYGLVGLSEGILGSVGNHKIQKYDSQRVSEIELFSKSQEDTFFCSRALALLSRFNLAAVISVGLNHSWLNQYTLRVEPSYLLQACMQILQRHWITRRNLQIMLILVFCNVFVLLLSARQVYLCSTCPTQRQKTRRYVKENK